MAFYFNLGSGIGRRNNNFVCEKSNGKRIIFIFQMKLLGSKGIDLINFYLKQMGASKTDF